ncbi:MAG: hypothetical protein ACRYHQ_31955 [Janthinobacterium lividum]
MSHNVVDKPAAIAGLHRGISCTRAKSYPRVQGMTLCTWLPVFLGNAVVKRVSRRMDISVVGFRRSTQLVSTCLSASLPSTQVLTAPPHSAEPVAEL